jgi:transcriptional regulator with XRE-family HTH domain
MSLVSRFKEALQYIMKKRKFETYEEVAKHIGISRQYLSDIINERKLVTDSLLDKLFRKENILQAFIKDGKGNMVANHPKQEYLFDKPRKEKNIPFEDDPDVFLLHKIIKIEAMLETWFELRAQEEANRTGQPFSVVYDSYEKAYKDKVSTILNELQG